MALLAGICLAKIFATAIGLGLGLPGGLIGPTLVMGAMAGGAMGLFADSTLPGEVATPAFYALVGMGTFMGATLQAPLAALTAMLELTANPHIILPGMLALIAAGLVSRELFGKDSVYLVLMKARGLDYHETPLTRALQRMGVASIMERRVESLARRIDREQAVTALSGEPRWILIREDNTPTGVMPAADLARHIETIDSNEAIDLMEIPATRSEIGPIDFQATLQEALDSLDSHNVEALYVTRTTIPGISRVYGVLTRKQIDSSYRI